MASPATLRLTCSTRTTRSSALTRARPRGRSTRAGSRKPSALADKGGAMPIEFKEGGTGYTLGVEEELHVVDATTAELAPKIEEIMSRLPEDLAAFVSYVLFQSVLEIKTPVCATAAEAEKHLRELRGRIASWAAAADASLAAAGTHPFSRYRDQKVTEQERYTKVIETLRWVAEREVIFGQHVHVGVPGPEECIH